MKFATEEEAREWVSKKIPIGIKPKRSSKYHFISPFVSGHAFDEVCKHLGKELFENQDK